MESNLKAKQAIIKQVLDNQELVNCTILTNDGGIFKVHMEFIAGMSPYFRRIVKSAATSAAFDTILISEFSKEVIENIINFIYTGELKISMNTVGDLTKVAELFEMPRIIKKCQKYLISNLNNETCLKVYISPEHFNIPGLKEEIKPYILRHFQEIFQISRDYLSLDLRDLTDILSSDDLNVRSENYVFWAIMRWVEHDPLIRIEYLPNLLRCVRFGLCDPEFYENNIKNHPYIKDYEDCHAITLQVSQLFADLPQRTDGQRIDALLDMRHPFLRPRTPNEIIFVMGGWSAGSATNIIETFDIKSGRWFLSLTSDTMPRAYHGMLWHTGYIYLIGGFDGNQCYNDVRRFDPESHIWEEKASMYVQRCYVSVASLDSYIYAMGGYDGHRRTRSCERYDPETNQWKMMAEMVEVRSDASADALKGKIYIAGGFNGQRVLNSFECYDPETNSWTALTIMNSPRSGVKLAAYNGYLYVIGGFNGNVRLQTAEKYDPRTRVWTDVPNMNGPRSNFAAAVMYDCLYVIGGFNGLTTIAMAECYDHRKDTWTLITELNLNRSALAACTVKDIPNAKEYTFLGVPYLYP